MSDVARADFWDAIYQGGSAPWDLGQPAPALVNWLASQSAPHGRALVLGAGPGHDAIALARAGYAVTAVDFSPSAVAEASARAEAAGVNIEWLTCDLFTLTPEAIGQFELVFEHTCFCAIPPERREDYADVVRALLAPGGRFFAIFFTHGAPGGPPFTTDRAEIERLFASRLAPIAIGPAPVSVARREGEETVGEFRRA